MLRMQGQEAVRSVDVTWVMPLMVKISIAYPNKLVRIVANTTAPNSDSTFKMVQSFEPTDKAGDIPGADLIAFDQAITLEEKRTLESTSIDVSHEPHVTCICSLENQSQSCGRIPRPI